MPASDKNNRKKKGAVATRSSNRLKSKNPTQEIGKSTIIIY